MLAIYSNPVPLCDHCGERPAVCLGVYEDPEKEPQYACGTCCAHGNEDGYCDPVPTAEDDPAEVSN